MKRIQRKRTKGWRMPEGAVYVGRPTKWGNPFYVTEFLSRERAVEWFAFDMNKLRQEQPEAYDALLEPLRGKDLACWCKEGDSCHGDVLLELLAAQP